MKSGSVLFFFFNIALAIWGPFRLHMNFTLFYFCKKRIIEIFQFLSGLHSSQVPKLQRIAGREKKAFLSDQCKEIEENNRMGKTRDLFKKIRDTKGTFHAKMGTIKDRNSMDLTEVEDIKKRWQEYTEKLYKKRSS